MKANLLIFVVAAVFFFSRPGLADEVAPGLEGPDLRVRAAQLLGSLLAAKPEPKLRGLYAAFDPSIADPKVMAACDDDGDYVIVISDAMLRLASYVANGATRIDDYAEFLARNQTPGKRLLPPAAGTYAPGADAHSDDRWNELVLFLYARELAHLRAGDLACPHPTTTKERGDDEWTPAEDAAAIVTARTVYPGKQAERDESAIAELRALGKEDAGALRLLQFFAYFEAAKPSRFAPSYLAFHPRSASRAAALQSRRPKSL